MPTYRRRNRLRKLQVRELSFVDRGANGDSDVLLAKRDSSEEESTAQRLMGRFRRYVEKAAQSFHETLQRSNLWQIHDAFQSSIRSIVDDEDLTSEEKRDRMEESFQQYKDELLDDLQDIDEEPDAGVSDGEDEPTEKRMRYNNVADANARIEELEKKLAELNKGGDGENKDDIMKSLPEEVRKRIEESEKRLKESEERIAKMAEETAERDRQSIAKSLLGDSTVVKVEDLSRVLKQVDEAGRKVVEELLSKYKTVEKQAKLFDEIGAETSGGSTDDLAKAAGELMKADPKLTREQAITKALEQNPDLYK